MAKWYGSINNRIEENRQFCDEIKVGTGVTEYFWSDRQPYEVTEVEDQKHVTIRRMDYKKKEGSGEYSNSWEYFSNPENPSMKIVKRGKYWYSFAICTPEEAKRILAGNDFQEKIWLCNNGFDAKEIIETGKTKVKYHRLNISFGVMEYYYDYSF